MIHRITDADGRGVELDDENPTHVRWAEKALTRMRKTEGTHEWQEKLIVFLRGALLRRPH